MEGNIWQKGQDFEKPPEIIEAENMLLESNVQQRRLSLQFQDWEKVKGKVQEIVQKDLEKEAVEFPKGVKEYEKKSREEDAKAQCMEEDKTTPDNWIKRHPSLIRQSGMHPLNAEPPTELLLEHGFITPASLIYVRNHGTVPKLDWDAHRLVVDGLLEKPREFSMDELLQFPSIEIPVTISCDGNRRKELNVIKHTRAYHWGCGAIGTAMWKGARLIDVLNACGLKKEEIEDKYVCFEGADKLAKDTYGTSIPLPIALNPTRDVILAYEMNGERLTPDHGYPVRVIVPGMIGGRMVKWLKKITISNEISQNYYHWHDNKVFPPSVDFSNVESGWWYKPEYELYNMNLNSFIVLPSHGYRLLVKSISEQRFTFKGIAYNGGGVRVTRVEVTLDDGKSWILCNVHYPEKVTRHGLKIWTWCFWDVTIDVWKIAKSSSICVRAWDRSCNTQPRQHTWNLMGMMNNSWYKVLIEFNEVLEKHNYYEIVFKHPVTVGRVESGWMEKAEKPSIAASMNYRSFSWLEVKEHHSKEDCWIVIDGDVYDVSNYMTDHPGGVEPLLLYAGRDVSREYKRIHGQDANEIKNWFRIGSVIQLPERTKKKEKGALNPRKWQDIKIIKKENVSHDTRHFVMEISEKSKYVGIDVGHHILLGANIDDSFVVRPYTPVRPVNDDEDKGLIDLVIKIYGSGKNKKKQGLFTSYLDKLAVGDIIKIKGPAGHMLYRGDGLLTIHTTTIHISCISMIAGGTGITPMYQLAKAIMLDSEDKTKVALLYSNHTEEDILLRKELNELAEKYKDRFKVWYTVSEPPENWKYSVGRVNDNMVRKHLFPSISDSTALICGPPAMVQHGCIPALKKAGYVDDNIYEF